MLAIRVPICGYSPPPNGPFDSNARGYGIVSDYFHQMFKEHSDASSSLIIY